MKNNKFIIIMFSFILFGILVLYPINFLIYKLGLIHIVSYSTKEAQYVENDTIIDKKIKDFKVSIENKVINYFPTYSTVNSVSKSFNFMFDKKLYNLLDVSYYPVGKNSDGEYIYKDNNHYILQNNLTTDELDKRFTKQINFFNNLDIENINIFIPYRYEYLNIDNSVYLRDLSKYSDKFKEQLKENISISEFKVKNKAEYLKHFYKTDHHYNAYGAYEAYKIIMDMLGETPINADVMEHDIMYYGSMARSAYSSDIYDSFYSINAKLPKFDVLVDKEINAQYKPKKLIKGTHKFFDYYISYYNGLFGLVEYNFHNDNKENILILQDSYGWQIDELIASHYNKSFVVDIRYYQDKYGELSLNEFIEKNNISKVLFLYEAGTVFFDQYDYNLSKKVVS